MFAAVYHGRGDVRIEDVPEPSPGPGEVKIRNLANGICGTDLKEGLLLFPWVIMRPVRGGVGSSRFG